MVGNRKSASDFYSNYGYCYPFISDANWTLAHELNQLADVTSTSFQYWNPAVVGNKLLFRTMSTSDDFSTRHAGNKIITNDFGYANNTGMNPTEGEYCSTELDKAPFTTRIMASDDTPFCISFKDKTSMATILDGLEKAIQSWRYSFVWTSERKETAIKAAEHFYEVFKSRYKEGDSAGDTSGDTSKLPGYHKMRWVPYSAAFLN